MMYFPPQCLRRWRPLWENIWINDCDWWDFEGKKKSHILPARMSHHPALLHGTKLLDQHYIWGFFFSFYFFSTQGAATKKSNNNLLLELFPLPEGSFQLRPGIGVMREWGCGTLGTRNCLPCELALFCGQFSTAGLDGEEAKALFPPWGTFFLWIRGSSDESRATALSLTSRQRRFSLDEWRRRSQCYCRHTLETWEKTPAELGFRSSQQLPDTLIGLEQSVPTSSNPDPFHPPFVVYAILICCD